MKGSREIVADAAALGRAAALRLREGILAAVRERGTCSVALAGGTTPRLAYEELARGTEPPRSGEARRGEPFPWAVIHWYFGDERCVPPADPESNYAMAKAALFDRAPIPPANVHRMPGELADRRRAAEGYEALLPEALDVLILGVGEDAHCASLFPHAPTLREGTRRVLPAESPAGVRHRLTITPPVIAAARAILVLVSGPTKAGAVARALEGPPDLDGIPAQHALRGHWILDRAASAGLRSARSDA